MSPKHYHDEGHIHYLTFSCYNKLWLFKSPVLYSDFLHHLESAKKKLNFKLFGYVVMPNHLHLLIYPAADTTITQILWSVKRPFASSALNFLQIHQPQLWAKLEVQKGGRTMH